MIIGVTGHRPDKIGGYWFDNSLRRWVREQVRTAFHELSPVKVISGMALGVDQDVVAICLEMQIPFIAAVPFLGQELAWPPHAQKLYHELLGKAAEVVHVCTPGYSRDKMLIRNGWIVEHCDLLLAVWDGSTGGTAHTVRIAEEVGRPIRRINPKERT